MFGADLSLTSLSVLSDRDGGTAVFFTPNGPLNVDAPAGTVVGYFSSRNGMNFTYTLTDDQNSNLEVVGNEVRVAGDLSAGTYTLAITVSNEDGWSQTITQDIVVEPAIQDIVAWGDSLTAGAGSTGGNSYPAVAAGLFDPDRNVVNRGVGGQTSTQIAARQGGVPIMVTVDGNELPSYTEPAVYTAGFTSSADGWTSFGFQGATAVVSAGKLVATAGANPQSGAQFALPIPLEAGDSVRLQATVSDLGGGATYVQGGLRGGGSGWNGAPGPNTLGARTIDETYVAGRAASDAGITLLLMPAVSQAGRTFSLDNVTIIVTQAATGKPVTYKSANVLYQSGNYTGSIYGTIDGIHGVMTTDASGNWTFTRDEPGSAHAVPSQVQFVPDDAETYEAYENWIWAGRNNAGNASQVKSDIAAMIAPLDHSRYLVGAILTSAADGAGTVTAIQALNADLASIYDDRFVDLYAILRSHGDGSANDTADISNGYIPRSLRSDDVHLNNAGYAIVAEAMVAATLAKGW